MGNTHVENRPMLVHPIVDQSTQVIFFAKYQVCEGGD